MDSTRTRWNRSGLATLVQVGESNCFFFKPKTVSFVFACGLRLLRVLMWSAAVDRAERAMVAGCRWWRHSGGVAGCRWWQVAAWDGSCEIRVGKGLRFHIFFIGLLQNEVYFFNWACCTLVFFVQKLNLEEQYIF